MFWKEVILTAAVSSQRLWLVEPGATALQATSRFVSVRPVGGRSDIIIQGHEAIERAFLNKKCLDSSFPFSQPTQSQ